MGRYSGIFNRHARERPNLGATLAVAAGVLIATHIGQEIRDSRREPANREGRQEQIERMSAQEARYRRERPEAPNAPYSSTNAQWQRPDGTVYQERPPASAPPREEAMRSPPASPPPAEEPETNSSDYKISQINEAQSALADIPDEDFTPARSSEMYNRILGRDPETAPPPAKVRTRDDLNELANYRRDLYATVLSDDLQGEAADSLRSRLQENAELGNSVFQQWRKDVRASGQTPASADYQGADTVLDKLASVAGDPKNALRFDAVKTMDDLNTVAGITRTSSTATATVAERAQFSPNDGRVTVDGIRLASAPITSSALPPIEKASLDKAAFTGNETTAMLNQMSAAGYKMMRVGQGTEATYVAFDKKGTAVGGLAIEDEGSTKVAVIDANELSGRLQAAGKTVEGVQNDFAKIPGGFQMASKAPAPEAPKMASAPSAQTPSG